MSPANRYDFENDSDRWCGCVWGGACICAAYRLWCSRRPGDLYGIWIPESKKGTADGSSLCCIISIKYVRIMRTCGCRHCPFLQWKTRVEIKMGILHILSAAFADSCRHLRAAF